MNSIGTKKSNTLKLTGLKIMKPEGAPRRLNQEFNNQKCPYHFVWCPCAVPQIEEEEKTRRSTASKIDDFEF